MYEDVFYRVKLQDGITETFSTTVGVKQGCVLSPTLFNLFISDLPNIFDESCCPVTLFDTSISCLMFADDLVLISQTVTGLQNGLHKLNAYCEKWHLFVNVEKTKIIVFNKSGKTLSNHKLYYNSQLVEVVPNYQYLGIIFSYCGSFTKAVEHLTAQALKALFKLKQKSSSHNIITSLKLFDTLILPIIRYCSEVWSPFLSKGLNDNNFLHLCDKLIAEKLHTSFCRYLLFVNKKTTNAAVRAELGRRSILRV